MAKFRLTGPIILVIGGCVLFIYLYMINELSNEVILILTAVISLSLLSSKQESPLISIEEAESIATLRIKMLQRAGHVIDGTVRIMGETELRSIVIKTYPIPTVEPYRWDVGILVEGDMQKAFLVKVSKRGLVLGQSQISIPENFKVTDQDEIIDVIDNAPELDSRILEAKGVIDKVEES